MGWSFPATQGEEKEMDEVVGIPIHYLLGKGMVNFKASLKLS